MASDNTFSSSLGIDETNVLDDLLDEKDNTIAGDGKDVKKIEEQAAAGAGEKKEEKIGAPSTEDLLGEELEEDDKKKKEEEEDKNKEKKEEGSEEEEETGTDFEIYSRELMNLGIFTGDEELPKTAEEFAQRFVDEKQKGMYEMLDGFLASKHGEEGQKAFEAIFVNGVDPRSYYAVANQITDFKGLDLTNEANQELIVREYYTRLGWNREQVNKKVDKLKDYADLEEESTTLHEKIVQQDADKLEQMNQAAQQKQLERQETDKNYKAAIVKVLEEKIKLKEFDGIPLDEKTRNKAFDFLYTKKWKLGDQELTDFDKFILETKKPENIEKRIKIALLENSGWDFSKIEKKAISKETNSLFTGLTRKDKQITKKAAIVASGTSPWANY